MWISNYIDYIRSRNMKKLLEIVEKDIELNAEIERLFREQEGKEID